MDMQLFQSILLGLAAFYLIGAGLVVETKDITSSVIFKVIPFFLGLGVLYTMFF